MSTLHSSSCMYDFCTISTNSSNKFQSNNVLSDWEQALVYIDTVELTFPRFLSPNELENWNHSEIQGPNNFIIHYSTKQFSVKNGETIFATYFPRYGNSNKQVLKIQLSIPKIIQGNNIEKIKPRGAIILLNRSLDECFPGLDLRVENATLHRLDIALNFKVSDPTSMYINVLRKVHYPHREFYDYLNNPGTGIVEDQNGISWKSKYNRTTVYDKYRESNDPRAKNILRLELSYRNKEVIQKQFGLGNVTLQDLSVAKLEGIIRSELHKLHLDISMPYPDGDNIEEIFTNTFGKNGPLFASIYKHRGLEPNISPKQLASKYDVSIASMKRYLEDIDGKQEEIAKCFKKSLPALVPDFSNTKNVLKSVVIHKDDATKFDISPNLKMVDSLEKVNMMSPLHLVESTNKREGGRPDHSYSKTNYSRVRPYGH